jgi:hypothetical protein
VLTTFLILKRTACQPVDSSGNSSENAVYRLIRSVQHEYP